MARLRALPDQKLVAGVFQRQTRVGPSQEAAATAHKGQQVSETIQWDRGSNGNKKKERRPFLAASYSYDKGVCQKPAGQSVLHSRHVCDHHPDPVNLLSVRRQHHRRIACQSLVLLYILQYCFINQI
jgi:hypothetical protein